MSQPARRYDRTALRWTVTVVCGRGQILSGMTLDISQEGMAVLVSAPIPVGARVLVLLDRREFPFLLTDGDATIDGTVVYARRRSFKADGPHRVGLQIRRLPARLARHVTAADSVGGIRVLGGVA